MGGSEESDPEEIIWDSKVNRYVVSDTDEEEGLQEGEADIRGEGPSDLESIDHQRDENCCYIAGSWGCLEDDCSEEEPLSGTIDSLPVIGVTSGRELTGTNTTIRVPLRKGAGTGRKEKKRSRFH